MFMHMQSRSNTPGNGSQTPEGITKQIEPNYPNRDSRELFESQTETVSEQFACQDSGLSHTFLNKSSLIEGPEGGRRWIAFPSPNLGKIPVPVANFLRIAVSIPVVK